MGGGGKGGGDGRERGARRVDWARTSSALLDRSFPPVTVTLLARLTLCDDPTCDSDDGLSTILRPQHALPIPTVPPAAIAI